MTTITRPPSHPLSLRPGETVQVKSASEILATLDSEGKLDGLPFMPEMLEYCGQTFTVSNIGAVGGGLGTPIVPYGTTAILSVGRVQDKVIARDGEPVVAPVMPLSLSYDHRVIDGARGRRFMALLIENLEEPALFLAG